MVLPVSTASTSHYQNPVSVPQAPVPANVPGSFLPWSVSTSVSSGSATSVDMPAHGRSDSVRTGRDGNGASGARNGKRKKAKDGGRAYRGPRHDPGGDSSGSSRGAGSA